MNNKNCNSCDSCNSCDFCDSCNSCDFCDSCNFCNFCDSCNFCDYCDFCDSCNFCNFCDSCNFCDYCRNLKMTEHNIFCYAENYGDENSFQQKPYRAFNKVVEWRRYWNIHKKINTILSGLKFDLENSDWSTEWKKVTTEQWHKLHEIPEAQDFRKGFEFISGLSLSFLDEPKHKKVTIKLDSGQTMTGTIVEEGR